MDSNSERKATGPRTGQGKNRSARNAREHRLSDTTDHWDEAELVEALFREYRKELHLRGAIEIAIGRKLASNEFRMRQVTDYEAHQFEVAEAFTALQTADRQLRQGFEEFFVRDITIHNGVEVPARRIPARFAAKYLQDLRDRIARRGILMQDDRQTVVYVYGKETDCLGATIITHLAKSESADSETLSQITHDVIASIDLAIEQEKCRSAVHAFLQDSEFASEAQLIPDAEMKRIKSLRIYYERQRIRLFEELVLVRRLKKNASRRSL